MDTASQLSWWGRVLSSYSFDFTVSAERQLGASKKEVAGRILSCILLFVRYLTYGTGYGRFWRRENASGAEGTHVLDGWTAAVIGGHSATPIFQTGTWLSCTR